MKRKYLNGCMLLLVIMVGILTFGSCSKDDDEEAPTYIFKTTGVSANLSANTNVMFKIQYLLTQQYDEGVQYIQADEQTAKTRFQKAISTVQNYNWENDGLTLETNSSFTLQLLSGDQTVVASQVVVLK